MIDGCVCVCIGLCVCMYMFYYLFIYSLFTHYSFYFISVVFIAVFNLVVACSFELSTIRPEQRSIERCYDSIVLSLNG